MAVLSARKLQVLQIRALAFSLRKLIVNYFLAHHCFESKTHPHTQNKENNYDSWIALILKHMCAVCACVCEHARAHTDGNGSGLFLRPMGKAKFCYSHVQFAPHSFTHSSNAFIYWRL